MELFNAKKSLKAAAGGSHGLFVGYSAGKKADNGKDVSGPEGTMTAVDVAVASASAAAAAAAVEAAKHAALASASAKHAALASASAKHAALVAKHAEHAAAAAKLAEEAATAAKLAEEAATAAKLAEKEAVAAMEAGAAAAEQAEEEVSAADDEDGDATDSDAEYDSQMSALEYILAYKALPQYEIDLILEEPVERVPFTDSELFKNLCADPSATQEDIDEAAAGYEERLDTRISFQEWVRHEYETKGYVVVSEEYIARRVEAEAFTKKLWEEGFAALNDDGSEKQEAGKESAQ